MGGSCRCSPCKNGGSCATTYPFYNINSDGEHLGAAALLESFGAHWQSGVLEIYRPSACFKYRYTRVDPCFKYIPGSVGRPGRPVGRVGPSVGHVGWLGRAVGGSVASGLSVGCVGSIGRVSRSLGSASRFVGRSDRSVDRVRSVGRVGSVGSVGRSVGWAGWSCRSVVWSVGRFGRIGRSIGSLDLLLKLCLGVSGARQVTYFTG